MAKGKKTGGRDFVPGDPRRSMGGLPPGYAVVRNAAREVSLEAVQTLTECMRDEDARIRIEAAKVLLERAWGKPAAAPEDLEALGQAAARVPPELVVSALEALRRGES